MTYIKIIEPKEAQGPLKKIYEALQENFGSVPNVFSAQSLRPDLLEPTIVFFGRLMQEEHGLSRTTKELIAAHVSKINSCAY